jgi:predicted nucleotidyltransferase
MALPIKIDKAILFGSVLTGKSNENSDIDLALFSTNFTDNILQNLDLIAMINIRFPDLDIHTYPTTAFNGKGFLLDEIKKSGLEMKL